MSNPNLQKVAGAVAEIFCETDPVLMRSVFQMMRLLLDGKPVPVERLATSAEISHAEAAAIFTKLRDWGAEFDEVGNVVGVGLTLVPTPHRYQVAGREFFTWCAPDALLFPLVLGHTATVESTDPESEEPVRLVIGPGGVASVEPKCAVVSCRSAGCDAKDVRGSTCQYGHFFVSRATAARYTARYSGLPLEVLTPDETFRVGQLMVAQEPLKNILETL